MTLKTEGCWLYAGARTIDGYACNQAHQRMWESVNGPLPAGNELHHLCAVKYCVRPDHLLSVTAAEHRMLHRGRTIKRSSITGTIDPQIALKLPIDLYQSVDNWMSRCIRESLHQSGGARNAAAELLSLSYRSFRHQAKRLKITS